MEYIAVFLIVAALWAGYKVGLDAGRTTVLDAQSLAIATALASENDFHRKTGLHGSYLLEGHEYRSPVDYVIVKFSDLERSLRQQADE